MLKGNQTRIAIIDDDEDDYFIIKDYIQEIEDGNFVIDWLSDYQSAIDKIKAKAYHLYFVDYRLGNETGLELLQEAASMQCDRPIVLLTGKGNKAIDIKAMQEGATDGELLHHGLFEFINEEKQKEMLHQVLEKEENTNDIEIEIQHQDGEVKPCLLSVSFQKDFHPHHLIHGIIHDITNIKRAEEANIQAQKLAANERLIRILAHEINKIITELLDLTKPLELKFEKFPLQEILDESLSLATDRINLQHIKVQKNYPDSPLEIEADKSKLIIAFTNLVINAIEAMETGRGELDVSISALSNVYTVSIRDNGKGIPEEYLSKLFEPFFTSKKNGMGLGLAACYSIIESHGGTIQVESRVNKGSNFIVSFSR